MSIVNIEANQNFLETVADFVERNFSSSFVDPHRFADAKLAPPLMHGTLTILFPNRISVRWFNEIWQKRKTSSKLRIDSQAILDIKLEGIALPPIGNTFSLAKKISKKQNLNFTDSWKKASMIEKIIEEIEKEGVDLKAVESTIWTTARELPMHLETLRQEIFDMIEDGYISKISQQKYVTKKFCESIVNSDKSIIIAGSSGSTAISATLIDAVSKLKNGYVFFRGASNFSKGCTPQFIATNPTIFEAKNKVEEARYIVTELKSAAKANQTAAIICEEKILKELIRIELKKSNIKFFDSDKKPVIADSKLLSLILLLIDLIENDFESITLLSVLKHPLVNYFDPQFELEVLRQKRAYSGLFGIRHQLKFCDDSLYQWFENFLKKLNPAIEPRNDSSQKLSGYFLNIIRAVEALTSKNLPELLAQEMAQNEIARWFEIIKNEQEVLLKKSEIPQTFKTIFSQIYLFENDAESAKIQLLSLLEARLGNWDLTILASLNENEFGISEILNTRELLISLGCDNTKKKLTQLEHHFFNHLQNKNANKEVILTRSTFNGSTPSNPSPLWLRATVKNLCNTTTTEI